MARRPAKKRQVLAVATAGLWLGLYVLNVSLTDAQPRCDLQELAAAVDEATTPTEAEPGWFRHSTAASRAT